MEMYSWRVCFIWLLSSRYQETFLIDLIQHFRDRQILHCCPLKKPKWCTCLAVSPAETLPPTIMHLSHYDSNDVTRNLENFHEQTEAFRKYAAKTRTKTERTPVLDSPDIENGLVAHYEIILPRWSITLLNTGKKVNNITVRIILLKCNESVQKGEKMLMPSRRNHLFSSIAS